MVCLPQKLLARTGLVVWLMFLAPPAHAYYWGYSPYGYHWSSIWPLRAVAYSLRGRGVGYGYSFQPAYLASSLIGPALYYNSSQSPHMVLEQYQDEEPLGSPRLRARPKRPSILTTDQIAKATWSPHSISQPAAIDPDVQSVPMSQTSTANLPLAQGFISLVNSKFNGDISAALFDPEARMWAKAIGLANQDSVFNADLDSNRVAIIKQVFQDDSLAPITKLQTVRLLLQ